MHALQHARVWREAFKTLEIAAIECQRVHGPAALQTCVTGAVAGLCLAVATAYEQEIEDAG